MVARLSSAVVSSRSAEGSAMAESTFSYLDDSGEVTVTMSELTKGRKAVLLSVKPGRMGFRSRSYAILLKMGL